MSRRYSELSPRVASQYRLTIYEELVKICDNIDFRDTVFNGRMKRNRSIGSAQALVVEIALTDDEIQPIMARKLRRFMERGGADWTPVVHYADKY